MKVKFQVFISELSLKKNMSKYVVLGVINNDYIVLQM